MNASVDDVKEFVAESREAALAMAESHFRASGGELETWVVPPSTQISGLGGRVLLLAALRSGRATRAESPREGRRPDRERTPAPERERSRDRSPRERAERAVPRSGPEAARAETPEKLARAAAREVEETPAPTGPLGQVGTFVAGILERMKLRDISVSEAETDEGEIVVTLAGRAIAALAERDSRVVAALSHLAHRAAEALIGDDAAASVEVRGAKRAPREEVRERSGRDQRRGDQRRGRDDRPGRSRDPEDRDIDEVELERLARDAARAVRESGEPELLPPMNSRERWFVHNALKDERGVRSESEGDGARKRIRIFPG